MISYLNSSTSTLCLLAVVIALKHALTEAQLSGGQPIDCSEKDPTVDLDPFEWIEREYDDAIDEIVDLCFTYRCVKGHVDVKKRYHSERCPTPTSPEDIELYYAQADIRAQGPTVRPPWTPPELRDSTLRPSLAAFYATTTKEPTPKPPTRLPPRPSKSTLSSTTPSPESTQSTVRTSTHAPETTSASSTDELDTEVPRRPKDSRGNTRPTYPDLQWISEQDLMDEYLDWEDKLKAEGRDPSEEEFVPSTAAPSTTTTTNRPPTKKPTTRKPTIKKPTNKASTKKAKAATSKPMPSKARPSETRVASRLALDGNLVPLASTVQETKFSPIQVVWISICIVIICMALSVMLGLFLWLRRPKQRKYDLDLDSSTVHIVGIPTKFNV